MCQNPLLITTAMDCMKVEVEGTLLHVKLFDSRPFNLSIAR